jgi:hypothetical protein
MYEVEFWEEQKKIKVYIDLDMPPCIAFHSSINHLFDSIH